jgi:hypothetical protein
VISGSSGGSWVEAFEGDGEANELPKYDLEFRDPAAIGIEKDLPV